MITEVLLPVLDQTGGEFVVARWLKREGDAVRAGEALCEVETGKANVEIEANASGVLRQVLIREGQPVPALTVLALVGDASDSLPIIDPFYRVARSVGTEGMPHQAPNTQTEPSLTPHATRHTPHASPRARKLAADHGVDLATVVGSGPAGRIIEDDVLRVIEAGG